MTWWKRWLADLEEAFEGVSGPEAASTDQTLLPVLPLILTIGAVVFVIRLIITAVKFRARKQCAALELHDFTAQAVLSQRGNCRRCGTDIVEAQS